MYDTINVIGSDKCLKEVYVAEWKILSIFLDKLKYHEIWFRTSRILACLETGTIKFRNPTTRDALEK
jgi:hypothetical protein